MTNPRTRLPLFLLIGLLAVVVNGCGETPVKVRNVVFILVDTLRADHLGCYGYHRETSPNIDTFAAENLLFTDVRSQSACTFPSVNSILTSTYPFRFLGQRDRRLGIPEHTVTLAQVLKANGMATFAVSASPVVRNTPSNRNHHGEFGQGFDGFDEACLWHPAKCVSGKALGFLDTVGDSPFFLYLHYMDPHDPYFPPKKVKRRFSADFEGPEFIRKGDPNPIEKMVYANGEPVELTAGDLQHLVDAYDDEIFYFDTEFGRLLKELERRGLRDSTMIVVASDHGEEFFQEHGHVKHCRALYDSSTATPLIIGIPGVTRDQAITVPVENIDITPTILDYLGADSSGFGFEGSSLRPVIERDHRLRDFRFSLQGAQRSVDDGGSKLIVRLTTGDRQLFDLDADPRERNNLFTAEDEVAVRLEGSLAEWRKWVEKGVRHEESVRVSEEAQERLKALGYLQ